LQLFYHQFSALLGTLLFLSNQIKALNLIIQQHNDTLEALKEINTSSLGKLDLYDKELSELKPKKGPLRLALENYR